MFLGILFEETAGGRSEVRLARSLRDVACTEFFQAENDTRPSPLQLGLVQYTATFRTHRTARTAVRTRRATRVWVAPPPVSVLTLA